MQAPKNLKTIFESTRTILQKADKISTPDNFNPTMVGGGDQIDPPGLSFSITFERLFV